MADAQQALKLIRAHAEEWKLNPRRVGLLGFSAGGNLLAHLACDRGPENTERPDFGIMIYGGGFLDPQDPDKLAPNFTVPANAPPMFIACAHDDKQNPIAATLLYLEYKKQNIPAELHLFTHGGHGFGMRNNNQPINQWPARCAEWMDSMGWLPTPAKLKAAISERHKALKHLVGGLFVCESDSYIVRSEIERTEQMVARAKANGLKAEVTALETQLESMRGALNKIHEKEAADRPRRNQIGRLAEELAALREEARYLPQIEFFTAD